MDGCGPFPTGEYVVRLPDCYSRWPEATKFRTSHINKHLGIARQRIRNPRVPQAHQDVQCNTFHTTRVQANADFLGNPIAFRYTVFATTRKKKKRITEQRNTRKNTRTGNAELKKNISKLERECWYTNRTRTKYSTPFSSNPLTIIKIKVSIGNSR